MNTLDSRVHGTMIEIQRKWLADNTTEYSEYLAATSIIGWFVRTYKSETKYALRVSFIVGHGLNGTDSEIEVTKECFEAVIAHMTRK